MERTWARVAREAGGRVRENFYRRDTALPNIDPEDGRRVEVAVTGLPIAHGLPVLLDATLVSLLHADGTPWRRAAEVPGISFKRARKHKETTYPELVDTPLLHHVVAATEVGGRFNREALDFIDAAAAHRASQDPPPLRKQAARAWRSRWITMLATAVQDTVAAILVQEGTKLLDAAHGDAPSAVDVWLDLDYAIGTCRGARDAEVGTEAVAMAEERVGAME